VFRIALLLLCLLPARLDAQGLRLEGDLVHPSAQLLREILERDRYRVLARDTVLPADFRASGDLIVLGADVRLEGEVEGSVAVVDGALYVRPGARIGGPIVSVRGEVIASGLATTGAVVEVPLEAAARVEPNGGDYTVTLRAPPGPPPLRFPGLFGLGLPTYDRVDGLTLRLGVVADLGGDSVGPTASAAVTYHSARGALGGGAALEVPLRPELWVRAEASRATVTNEEWIRGALVNSLAALTLKSDARDYFRSDAAALTLERRGSQPLIAGEGRVLPRLTVRVSRDRSLEASDPWSLFGDEPWRANPPIDPGTLASVVGGAAGEWKGQTATFAGDAALEWAPPGIGDFDFAQAVATGQWAMQGLWRHAIGLFVHTRMTLGSDPAPAQRWSIVGGSGTLPTLERGELRGDRLLLVSSSYSIPLPRLPVPVLGPPDLRFEHAVGSAWVTGTDPPRWEQNLGAGLDFGLVRGMVYINPADGVGKPTLSLSAGLPF
jgi:hypothetical protein